MNCKNLGCLALSVLGSIIYGFIFERSRSFSKLSNIEKEMSLRTEQGFYYSFYKEVVSSTGVSSAFRALLKDNKSEYGTTINSFERFNIYPEFVLGLTYKFILTMVNMTDHLGFGPLPILAMNPMYFYLFTIFGIAGWCSGVTFKFGSLLSDSFIGGILALVCFYYNIAHATRVQWAPGLRECFGYPFILLQTYYITKILKTRSCSDFNMVSVVACTVTANLSWQFSQFIWSTQVTLLFILSMLYDFTETLQKLLLCHLVSFTISAVLLCFNKLFITSLYPTVLVGICIASGLPTFKKYSRWLSRSIATTSIKRISTAIFGSVLFKFVMFLFIGSKDGDHVWSILRSKFTDYQDFDSMLYTCTPEFDFLPLSTFVDLCQTLLLPSAYLAGPLVLFLSLIPSAAPAKQEGFYQNPQQMELFEYISSSTNPNDSFAGAMSIMANLKLSTGRPIVNHPHYENEEIRLKTRKIYRAFGPGSKEQLGEELRDLQVKYLVVDALHCYSEMRRGCSIMDVLNTEYELNKSMSVICEEFFEGNPTPFEVVFQNEAYSVLKVPKNI
ncbi:protein C-mannosyl-transferase DPY19L1-like isoform X4 [Artemia franciscana]|uniref:protein C-mannosyl-transferase DPY19L1-like isoform X4 n=1 Tax=Artemia franciscana TaxID=6661 RepID=UPI0032DB4D3B